jgi:RNA polymerase sigma-70 factor (ECF subfamily)
LADFQDVRRHHKATPAADPIERPHEIPDGNRADGGDRDHRRRFEAIALPHLDAAYTLARWMTRNDADAADIVQEAFLRAFYYFASYRGGNAKSWLLRIVRRTCYNWIERNRPPDVISFDAAAEAGDSIAIASVDTEALLENRSDLQRLDRMIEALPAPLREVIVLRELHELGYREIAEVTSAPIGTVMSRLYRGRSLLLTTNRRGGAVSADVTPLARAKGLPGA